ncbi:RICIN domain-containing protein [Saccharothrix luteola]|uniref:RICIN domain-containing protein n=1 Tax=Saccharothrix luteola TaxID=2893018 RepID=UPI001E2C0A84|nr:RICIN domain-containing protein [Saccharothrix luteola]MCC8249288.1 RICIN domain-containing protein [Saccharothrix luteola]
MRTWSGLIYQQIEGKAAANKDALPASTIATTLGRAGLPRERFVDAFTRACGLGEDDVRRWLEVRRRLAPDQPAPAADRDPAGDERDAARPSRWRRVASLVAAAVFGAATAVGATALIDIAEPAPSGLPVTGLPVRRIGSWARVHPARTPDLSVTEGVDRTGRYGTAVAARRPCTGAPLPRVFIGPVDEDVVQIRWHHPEHGVGCLTVLVEGPGRDLVEPREDCAEDDPVQRFRIEPFGPPVADRFRIRPVVTDHCLSLRDQDTEDGAEVVQGRCAAAADQEFLIELIPPP